MKSEELATLVLRGSDYDLDWEVLMSTFQYLIHHAYIDEGTIENAIRHGLAEWDV